MVFLILISPAIYAQDNSFAKKILILHSYHPDYEWVQEINQGIEEVLSKKDFEVKEFYMDTKRNPDIIYKTDMGIKAREFIADFNPDIVIAVDDNAQMFVTQYYVNKDRPYFVFCGVNGKLSDYNLPASNVTGVLEIPHFNDTINFAKSFLDIRRVAVLSDNSPTSMGALDYIRRSHPNIKVIGYHLIDDFSTWKKRIEQYNIDADALIIYTYHTIKYSQTQKVVDPKEVVRWTVDNSTIPILGLLDFAVKDGFLCGVVESGYDQGFRAAQMAVKLLSGTDIRELPPVTSDEGKKIFNMTTAKRLNIVIPNHKLKDFGEIVN